MAWKSRMNLLLVLGLAGRNVHGIKTQAQANAVCNRYQAGYIAVMKQDGSDWGSCIPPPEPTFEVCFGSEYFDPKTGASGCCPEESPFSYDAVSLTGKCCPVGNTYSYDPVFKTGDCCSGGAKFSCSCGSTTQAMTAQDTCPGLSTDGSQKRVEGSTEYKFFCGKYVIAGALLKPGYRVPTLQQCARDCSANPSCKSFYYGFGNVGNQNRVGECNLVSGTQGTPTGIDQDFVAGIPDPAKGTAPMQVTDTCPALGLDGSQSRTEGSVEYKFYCGKYVVQTGGMIKPSYKVGSLQECLRDCSANPSCASVHYGFANTLNQNRVGECNLLGGTETTPTGVHADFVAAIPSPPRAVTPAPLLATDTCPNLGVDGKQIKTVDSVTYRFHCGKYVVVPAGYTVLVKPSYKVSSLQQCLQDCSANTACKSVHYGFANSRNENRVGECNLLGGTQTTPTGVHPDFVAVIPDPAR